MDIFFRRLLAAAIVLLSAIPAGAQITFDAAASASTPTSGASTLSWSHTVGSASNSILVVGLAINRATGATSVTYDGQNLARQVLSTSDYLGATSEIWTLLAPPIGTAPIVVTTLDSIAIVGGSVSFTGVDQTTPIRASNQAGRAKSGATNVSTNVTTQSGDLVIDAASCSRPLLTFFGPAAGQTIRWTDTSAIAGGGSTKSADAGSTTMTWGCSGRSNSVVTEAALSALSLIPATFADLAVTKSGAATMAAGNNITYTIGVTNNGPDDAQSVTLSDTLPAGMTFVSETQDSGPAFTCTNPAAGAAGTVSCTIPALAPGASVTFTLVGQVAASTAPGTTITNTATVNSSSTDLTPGNNSAAASTIVSVGNVDLSITSTPSAPPYGTGLPITYTINVSNAGPAPAAGVTVTDVIPTGTTFVSATPSQGSCSGALTVTCTLGTLASGGTATISLGLTLPATPGTISNTASVTTSNPDTNAANNAASSTITVIEAAAIPALSSLGLLLLALVMATVVVLRVRG